jgi:phage baseplate assembly protein V
MVAPSSIAEISRLLNNLIRLGTIAAIDAAARRCRVRSGELLTAWLPWVSLRAGDVRTWSPPSVGEQCTLLSPGGDLAAAVVLLGLYSDANPAPSSGTNVTATHYPDGAFTSYDHAAHTLNVTLPDGGRVSITAPASVTVTSPSVTIDAEQTTCTGMLTIQGRLTYQGGMAGSGSAGGGAAAVIQGTVQVSDDVTAGGISLHNHTHSGVRSGGENTGGPQ